MERIQTAIEKARKARQSPHKEEPTDPGEEKAEGTYVLPKAVALPERDKAWSALARFDPKQAFLEQKRI